MKSEFLFDAEYLTEETNNFKSALIRNKGRYDLGAHGAEIIAKQVIKRPIVYRRYGPYWWAVKEVIIKYGLVDWELTNPEISGIYRGKNDDETLAAAQLFYNFYLKTYFDGNNRFLLDPDEAEEWLLYDPDIEKMISK